MERVYQITPSVPEHANRAGTLSVTQEKSAVMLVAASVHQSVDFARLRYAKGNSKKKTLVDFT